MKDQNEIKEQITVSAEYLANLVTENNGVYREYSDKDLVNATMIFQEFLMARMYKFHRDKLNDEGLEKLAEEAGKSLRQSILIFTGVDMHEAVKK